MDCKMAKIKLISEAQMRYPFGNFPEILKAMVNRDCQLGLKSANTLFCASQDLLFSPFDIHFDKIHFREFGCPNNIVD